MKKLQLTLVGILVVALVGFCIYTNSFAAVAKVDGGRNSYYYTGLSTDTKPTTTAPNFSYFYETDTAKIYVKFPDRGWLSTMATLTTSGTSTTSECVGGVLNVVTVGGIVTGVTCTP